MNLDQEQIIGFYRDRNMSYQQISDKLGCSHTAIGKIIRESGIKRRSPGGKSQGGGRLMYAHEREARNRLIKSLWNAGLTIQKIANQVNISVPAVCEILDKFGIKNRDREGNAIKAQKTKLLCQEVYSMGFSVAKTAEIIGVSNPTVRKHLDRVRTHVEQKQCDARAYRKDINAVLNEAHELVSRKLARAK
jgi:predicted transcriptional regulator